MSNIKQIQVGNTTYDIKDNDALRYSMQSLTEAQKIQAIKNLDGVRIVKLTDGTETLSQIVSRLNTINQAGEHVFFDVASLTYPLYLCTIAISYTGQTPTAYKLSDLVTGSISQGVYDGTKTLATILSEAVAGFHNITITCTATDGVSVTGQTIYVKDAGSGQVFDTLTYNGQPLTVVVPHGFSYEIYPVCTLANHYYSDGHVTGVAKANVSTTFSFKDLNAVQTFLDLKSAMDLGLGESIPIGKQVSFTHATFGTLAYDVVDYDDATDTITLLQHDVLADDRQFDASEASYYAENGLAAGAYSFIHGGTTYYFTLNNAVPAAGQVRFTDTEFQTWAVVGSTSVLESGSVSTTVISGATALGTTAAGAINHMDRIKYGSNNYAESALRQWLESNKPAWQWWEAKTHFDRPPSYAGIAGFLAGVPAEVLEALDTSTAKCHTTATYKAPDSQYPINSRYEIQAKFFLASEKEIYGTASYDDGTTQFDAYVGTDNSAKIKYYNSSARTWWLRAPYPSALYERRVNTSGADGCDGAFYSLGVVPACKMSGPGI